MSLTAISRPASLDSAAYAARLIPGQGTLRAKSGKRVRALQIDDHFRIQENPACESRQNLFSALMRFVVPTPFSGDHPAREWAFLLADHALIVASWILVAVVWETDGAQYVGRVSGALVARSFWLQTLREGALFAVIATLLGYSEGVYAYAHRYKPALIKSLALATVLFTGIGSFGICVPSLSRSAVSAGLSLASLSLWRRWREHVCVRRWRQGFARNVLIIGAGSKGQQVANYLRGHPEWSRIVRGFLDNECDPAAGVFGPPGNLAAIASAEFVDEIILAEPHRRELAEVAIREGRRNHLDIKIVPELYGHQLSSIEDLGSISVFALHQEKVPAAGLIIKRLLDLVLSSCLFVLTAPLLLAIAGLIRLDSPGAAIYSALRVGKKGRRFRCHKFRTMVANANEIKETLRTRNQREGPTFKIADDPRITRVGRWLRRYSLDELPQLWNVWKGDMSLVGPRPHPLDDYARYRLEHLRRLDVTPGITGLWQVTARRSSSFQTNMALDLEYIERWSLWMDLRILLKTVAVVFQGTGA